LFYLCGTKEKDMKNGRINERNTGNYTLDGNAKTRRSKVDIKLSDSDKVLAKSILFKVYEAMEFDATLSERGHLHPDAKFTDGGRITLSMNRTQFEQLSEIIFNKLA
jgi:hypothetical protein